MTPNIPLNLKIKKKAQKNIAYAQDVLVEELYNFFPNAIIHGGTAIWRCYNGNRFSEDIDVYILRELNKIEDYFLSLKKKGFIIIKKRIKENSIYSELLFNETQVRFEATFQTKKKFVLKRYETSESFFINVYTLTPENLVIEKIDTYLKRRKIRDLYDINFLRSYAQKTDEVNLRLIKLIKNYQKPLDEENLGAIIISGAIPNSNQLIESIERWAK